MPVKEEPREDPGAFVVTLILRGKHGQNDFLTVVHPSII
jgi:hypothetical protein